MPARAPRLTPPSPAVTPASAELPAAAICLLNLVTAESIKLCSAPKTMAEDVVLNCQPHPAAPERPSLSVNLFSTLSLEKEVGGAGTGQALPWARDTRWPVAEAATAPKPGVHS